MKILLYLLALVATAIAAAIAIPPVGTTISPVMRAGDPAKGPFYQYTVDVKEYCSGDVLAVKLDYTQLNPNMKPNWRNTWDFQKNTNIGTLVIHETTLKIEYDFENHWTNYKFENGEDGCQWGQDMYAASSCGMCYGTGQWSDSSFDCKKESDQGKSRTVHMPCWINMSWGGWDKRSNPVTISSQQTAPSADLLKSKVTAVAPGTRQVYTPEDPSLEHAARGMLKKRYDWRRYIFTVTEYCPSTPKYGLREAKVSFRDDKDWYALPNVFQEGTKSWNQISLDGSSHPFIIGSYDFATSRLHMSYKNCKWDQDSTFVCGNCISKPWDDLRPLQCGLHPGPRSHQIECNIALDHPGPKPRAKRAETTSLVEVAAAPARANSEYGFIYFNLQVTEYCSGSPGNPLMADALWTDQIGTWKPFSFGDGTGHEAINIGYPSQLEIAYNYYTAKTDFKFGDCVWNEDMNSTLCGACAKDPWSAVSSLKCVNNAWASRSHTLYCRVQVEYRDSSTSPKPLKALGSATTTPDTGIAAATGAE